MDPKKFAKALREAVKNLRAEATKTPASAVATNAALGSSAIILATIAEAVEQASITPQ